METQCPSCRSTVHIDLEQEVRADGGTEVAVPDGLRGERRYCGECGHLFSVYVY
jgi:hypothetical protein